MATLEPSSHIMIYLQARIQICKSHPHAPSPEPFQQAVVCMYFPVHFRFPVGKHSSLRDTKLHFVLYIKYEPSQALHCRRHGIKQAFCNITTNKTEYDGTVME
jgi:hypothetical protein